MKFFAEAADKTASKRKMWILSCRAAEGTGPAWGCRCSRDGSAPCSLSFNFRAARSKHGEGNKKAMLGVTPGSLWLSLSSSVEQSCRRKDRKSTKELVEGNDQLLGKHWQLPGLDSVPDRKPVTWKCLAGIMNDRACALSLRSVPCPG